MFHLANCRDFLLRFGSMCVCFNWFLLKIKRIVEKAGEIFNYIARLIKKQNENPQVSMPICISRTSSDPAILIPNDRRIWIKLPKVIII